MSPTARTGACRPSPSTASTSRSWCASNAPFARNLALSHDPQQQFLYVGGGTDIVVVDRKSMEIVGSIEGGGVIGGGHQIGVDSKGNLYVAATGRGLQKLTFKGLAPAASALSAAQRVNKKRQGGDHADALASGMCDGSSDGG